MKFKTDKHNPTDEEIDVNNDLFIMQSRVFHRTIIEYTLPNVK